MKNILIILFCSLILVSATENSVNNKISDCKEFHIGKFEIIDESINHHVIIERNSDIQIEKNQISGAITKCSVKWINECTYELTYLESEEEILQDLIGKTVLIEITRIEGSKYYFDALLEGTETKQSHYIVKIE